MSGLETYIFSTALVLFLSFGAARLLIEELIALVILYKKLKATIKVEYSLPHPEMRTLIRRKPSRISSG